MKQSNIFILNKDIPEENAGEGVTRRMLGYDKNIMLVKVSFESGAIGAVHNHPHVQTSYIESGKFEVTIDGEKQLLEKGDGFFVPSNSPHGVVCIEEGAIIDTFTPARKDFL